MQWEPVIAKVRLGFTGDYVISRESVEHSTKAWRSALDALGQTSDFGATLMETIKVHSSLLSYAKEFNPSV
jgi:hypothetical protein